MNLLDVLSSLPVAKQFCLECRRNVDVLVELSTSKGKGYRKACQPCKERIEFIRKSKKSNGKPKANA